MIFVDAYLKNESCTKLDIINEEYVLYNDCEKLDISDKLPLCYDVSSNIIKKGNFFFVANILLIFNCFKRTKFFRKSVEFVSEKK